MNKHFTEAMDAFNQLAQGDPREPWALAKAIEALADEIAATQRMVLALTDANKSQETAA